MPAFHGLTSARQNPTRPGRSSGTRTSAGGRRGGRQTEVLAVARCTGCRRSPPRRRTGGHRRGGIRTPGGGGGRGGESGRGAASDGEAREWGRTSARPSSPAAGDDTVRVSGRSGASERSGAAPRRRGACRGLARRGVAAATTTEEGRWFWGNRLSADLEGDRAYVEPPTFCHGSYYQPWQKAL
jgi:hypothetical protein